jgi:rod shape-determining protein MreD
MRFIYFPVLLGAVLVFQSAVVPVILPAWFVDGFDLPLIVVLHVAMTRGKNAGMLTGLGVGYLQDAMSGGVLGFNGISKIVAGYLGGYLQEKFFVRSLAHRTASVAGAVFMALLVKVAVLALFAQPGPSLLSTQFVWGFAGNTLFTLLAHNLLVRLETVLGIRVEEELSLGD